MNVQLTLLEVLVLAALVSAECDACFEGICYSKTIVFTCYGISHQFAVDRSSNDLYFYCHTSSTVEVNAKLDLDTNNYELIFGVGFTFARTVDQTTRDVYMTTFKGIYKYSPITNITKLHGHIDKTIWHVQFKDKLYYTDAGFNGLYTFENGSSTTIPALSNNKIIDFIVDKNDNIFFVSDKSVYRLKKEANQATVFSVENYALATDKFDNAYFINPLTRGIYKMDYSNDRLLEVGAFADDLINSVVFDKDNNVIYHKRFTDKIFYLKPNNERCSVTTSDIGKIIKKEASSDDDSKKTNFEEE